MTKLTADASIATLTDGVDDNEAVDVNLVGDWIEDIVYALRRGVPIAEIANTPVALTGNLALDDDDVFLQYLDPNGTARDVTLPAEASTNGAFFIVNVDTVSDLTVKNDAAATIGTVAAGEAKMFVSDGADWKVQSGGGGGRETLTANRTYYVRTDGSDSNDGLTNSAGGAFLTIQKAVDVAVALDASIYDVTISVQDGTYTAQVELKNFLGSGTYTLSGTTSAIISTTSEDAILCDGLTSPWLVSGLKVQTTTSGSGFRLQGASALKVSGTEIGACATAGFTFLDGSTLFIQASYTISGGAIYHLFSYANSSVIFQSGITVTISGTPAFSTSFAYVADTSLIRISGITFSGSATGKRYTANVNGAIFTNGGGATYLPGDSAGSTATGGQYV